MAVVKTKLLCTLVLTISAVALWHTPSNVLQKSRARIPLSGLSNKVDGEIKKKNKVDGVRQFGFNETESFACSEQLLHTNF